MKSRIYALVAAYTVFALAGCSGGTPSAPPLSSVAPQGGAHADAFLIAEVLKARRIVVKVQSCISGSGGATFTVKGKAKGPFRGKFVAKGQWGFYSIGGQTLWTFAETFRIKGAHRADGTITGSGTDSIAKCKTFGPVSNLKDLQYHLGTKSGAATTNLLKNGGKLLQRLH
jgi:hypothetical protein